jgi:hypothetical protein
MPRRKQQIQTNMEISLIYFTAVCTVSNTHFDKILFIQCYKLSNKTAATESFPESVHTNNISALIF